MSRKPSQGISWDRCSQPYSCQYHQEWTQPIKTPWAPLRQNDLVPSQNEDSPGWLQATSSHRSRAATAELWQRCRRGSTVLFRKEAQIVWAMDSGIKKALASIGSYRNIWAMTSNYMHLWDNLRHLFQQLTSCSVRGSAIKLTVLGTRNHTGENSHWFQLFYVQFFYPT